MGPIVYVFLAIGVIIALVGLARGYNKELGNSIILMFTIAAIGFIELTYEAQIQAWLQSVLGIANSSLFIYLIYMLTFIAIVFSSYSGIVFIYGGTPISGFFGQMISLGVGIFNGYLISGTLWYYANRFGYPLVPVELPLPPQTANILNYLPQTIFPSPVYWVIPATVLLLLRIRG